MDTAVSTTGFRNWDIERIIQTAESTGMKLEFSSGVPYRPDLANLFLNAPCAKLIHNYFPAPEQPFVLNLASLNDEIYHRTLEHCKRCLKLAAQTKVPFYSVHAGFCLDPEPGSLGKKLNFVPGGSRAEHWKRFLSALDLLVTDAKALGLRLLIENNVIAKMNLLADGSNPLLCADADEIIKMFREGPQHSLGMLLDTGHWKVSANVLGFSPDDISRLENYIEAIHHSDNNGLGDQNAPLTEHYWFLKYIPRFKNATHVLEVNDQTIEQIQHQLSLLEKAS